MYERSLEYFDKVVRINEQIGVKDPGPHLSIARTYSQLGEFFIAARNVQTALEYEPTNADIYGQLGIIYFRSRGGYRPASLTADDPDRTQTISRSPLPA